MSNYSEYFLIKTINLALKVMTVVPDFLLVVVLVVCETPIIQF